MQKAKAIPPLHLSEAEAKAVKILLGFVIRSIDLETSQEAATDKAATGKWQKALARDVNLGREVLERVEAMLAE